MIRYGSQNSSISLTKQLSSHWWMISKILNKKYVFQIKAFSYLHLQSTSWYLHVLFWPYSSDDICTLELSFVQQKIILIFAPNNIYEHYISSMCHCPFEDEKGKSHVSA